MFAVYGIEEGGTPDCEKQFGTLSAALAFLRDGIADEMTNPAGAMFVGYGLSFDKDDAPTVARQLRAVLNALPKAAK